MKCYESTHPKTDMTMEKQQFQDVSPIKHVSLPEGKSTRWCHSLRGFHTLLVPVNEVVKQDEEDLCFFLNFSYGVSSLISITVFSQDWMSVTVVNRGDSNVFEEGTRVGVVILVFG